MTITKRGNGKPTGFSFDRALMRDIMKIIRHATADDPVKAHEIAIMVGVSQPETVRRIILECMEYDPKFVPVAGNRGYYLARSEQQVDDYLENLKSRMSGIHKRITLIQSNYKTRRGR